MNKNELLSNLKTTLLASFGDNINNIILFGSQATQTANKYSDFDILIVLNNNYNWRYKDKIRDVICEFEIENDIFIDMKIISEKEKNTIRWYQPLFINAFKNGLYL